jgi:hypothetical protein
MDLEPGGFTSHNTYEDIYIYMKPARGPQTMFYYVFVIEGCVQVPSCLSDLALAAIGIMRS